MGAQLTCSRRTGPARPRGLAPFYDFDLLLQLGHAVGRKDALPLHAGVNDRIASDHGTGAHHGIASNFSTVADNRAEFAQTGRHGAVRIANDHLGVVEAELSATPLAGGAS